MTRDIRYLPSNSYHHITARGNNKMEIFKKLENFNYFIKLIQRFKKEHPFHLYHYCLMPSHIHLQIKNLVGTEFSAFMKKLGLAYFHHYKRQFGWEGHFWQDRFRNQLIDTDEYFIQCGKYIELNPVKAGLVKKPEDWKWSSYRYYALGEKNNLITEDILYPDLAKTKKDRQREYRSLIVDEEITKDIEEVSLPAIGVPDYIHYVKRRIEYQNKDNR